MGEHLSGACSVHVIVATWPKRTPELLKEALFVNLMIELFLSSCKWNFIVGTWQNVPLVYHKKYDFGHMTGVDSRVAKDMLLDRMARTLSKFYKRKVIFARWHERSLRVPKGKFFLSHGMNVHLAFREKCEFCHMVEMLYLLVPKVTLYRAHAR